MVLWLWVQPANAAFPGRGRDEQFPAVSSLLNAFGSSGSHTEFALWVSYKSGTFCKSAGSAFSCSLSRPSSTAPPGTLAGAGPEAEQSGLQPVLAPLVAAEPTAPQCQALDFFE